MSNEPDNVEDDPVIVQRYEEAREIYLSGDKPRGMELMQKLAEEGTPQAQYFIGQHYLYTDQTSDPQRGLRWFSLAAESSFAPAFYCLGKMHLYGWGVDRSLKEAFRFFVKGLQAGDANCGAVAGDLLVGGELGDVRHDLALPAYWEAARRGSALAQRRLGFYYSEGKEVELDLTLARELYEAAAEQGDEYASHGLALMYADGRGVPRDLEKAIHWYTQAAEKGIALSKHNLATCYAHPESPIIDLELAAYWFHQAAEHGLKLSMQSLGRIYEFGEGVERDLEKARYWKEKAEKTEDHFVNGEPAPTLH